MRAMKPLGRELSEDFFLCTKIRQLSHSKMQPAAVKCMVVVPPSGNSYFIRPKHSCAPVGEFCGDKLSNYPYGTSGHLQEMWQFAVNLYTQCQKGSEQWTILKIIEDTTILQYYAFVKLNQGHIHFCNPSLSKICLIYLFT